MLQSLDFWFESILLTKYDWIYIRTLDFAKIYTQLFHIRVWDGDRRSREIIREEDLDSAGKLCLMFMA